jgi:hypothetical protein
VKLYTSIESLESKISNYCLGSFLSGDGFGGAYVFFGTQIGGGDGEGIGLGYSSQFGGMPDGYGSGSCGLPNGDGVSSRTLSEKTYEVDAESK